MADEAKSWLSNLIRLPQALRTMATDVGNLNLQIARIDRDLVAGLEDLSKGFQRLDAQLASGARKPDDVARRSDIAALGQSMARIGDAVTRLAEAQERTERTLHDLQDAIRGADKKTIDGRPRAAMPTP